MTNNSRKRLIWEEIMRDPDIYRVCEAGSSSNSYVFFSGEDVAVIDPSSEDMIGSICRLAHIRKVDSGRIRIYLTQPGRKELCTDSGPAFKEMKIYCCGRPYRTISEEADEPDRKMQGRPEAEEDAYDKEAFPWKQVRDGDLFRIGSRTLRIIGLEACRKGLTGLWFPEKKLLFAGEAVGADEVPGVYSWDPQVDTLGLQIEVLRRVKRLCPQMILPARGRCIGVDQQGEKGAEECLKVLDAMLVGYCLRILEVYQKVPARGGIRSEEMFQEDESAGIADTESGLKYLLYRRYIRQTETSDGFVYERSSRRLTDWNLQEKDE